MALIARIIGLSLLTAGLGAWIGLTFLGKGSDASGIAFVLGCVGAIVGALAGTAHETAAALRQKPSI
jgi:hypothetical protein